MKKAKSLRSRITIFMTILVALQSVALLLCLIVSQVFTILDQESVRLFSDTAFNRTEALNASISELVVTTAGEAQELAAEMADVAALHNLTPLQLTDDEAAHDEAMALAAERVLSFLGNHDVTASYVALESSFYRPGEHAHDMVYIRTNTPSTHVVDYTSFMLEVGPTWVASDYQLPMSGNWTLDYTNADDDGIGSSFYHTPVELATGYPGSEITRFGYWTNPGNLLGDGEQVITYSIPLLDSRGTPFGVFGFEISVQYLSQEYMPSIELPFANSFYAVTGIPHEGELDLSWFIPSGTVAQIYLRNAGGLSLSSTRHDSLQQSSLAEIGAMYISVNDLEIYNRNSPYVEDGWSLVAFVSVEALDETSTYVRNMLTGSLAVTTVIALLGVVFLSFWSTRKISGLSARIKRINRYDKISIGRTGFAEVDELIHEVETLNQSVVNSGQRISKIMELTEMPIGCFEILDGEVFLTDQVHHLLGFDANPAFTLAEWEQTLARIAQHPEPDNENVYHWVTPKGEKWLRVLTTSSDNGTVGLIVDVSDEILNHKRLSEQLDFDAMTGLFNRNAFKREAFARIQADPEGTGALIFADLDNLKYINDTYGHESGDVLLKSAGDMFSRFAQHGGVVARIAGDEFAMYLHGLGSRELTLQTINDVVDSIANSTIKTPDGMVHRIRFSAGIAWYPDDSGDVTDLLKLADFAMYEAKHKRKGTVVEFNPDDYKETSFLWENSETISRLLDERLIRFDFQPIVDLQTGEVFAYEALMRSKTPEFKGPMDILSVASAQSKLYQLEHLVCEEVFHWVQAHHGQLGGAKIFMNSLPSQSLSAEDLAQLRAKYPDAVGPLVVEITENENTPMRQIEEKLDLIRVHGMPFAIDDFGAGYSNELRILALQPDFVKLDMGIIQGVSCEGDKRMLVASIVSFCHAKGIRTIAEGVEDTNDLRAVIGLGIDYVQGYITGRPAPELQPPLPEALEVIREHLSGQNI